ncbi:hypothetical protein GCM10023172_42610 [Hymenobacter ginsengisoli]|uniref:Heavy metal binding domain-containing protein n=1 Tax=Hymenobacter ginsengisoli TaxID=1051626 RepID=A0ABP8QTB1_9BACT|nr:MULTISPECIES: heavy metal-binding domain-containing protein [unclassified Hymenobacter]MBO2033420.1 hypothetical protein [Hymenobacter sp. BT559]
MTTSRISLVLLTLLAMGALTSHAQQAPASANQHGEIMPGETHAHVAPHGGVVHSSGSYHLELVPHSTSLEVYLYGPKMSVLPKQSATGTVLVESATKATSTVTLTPIGSNQFSAKLPAGTKLEAATVKLKVADQDLSVRFEKLGAALTSGKTVGVHYTCTMHPEVSSTKPGKCPKCGMTLVKKS